MGIDEEQVEDKDRSKGRESGRRGGESAFAIILLSFFSLVLETNSSPLFLPLPCLQFFSLSPVTPKALVLEIGGISTKSHFHLEGDADADADADADWQTGCEERPSYRWRTQVRNGRI